MGDAFIYMYFVGAGTAAGVATVGLITWKIVKRSNNKAPKKRGIV
ncbi:hypothetical protein V7127_22690 [Bacillus sp. JJ1773]